MAKIHYTAEYNWTRSNVRFITPCGIASNKHKKFINATIIEERVNCKTCKKIIKKTI